MKATLGLLAILLGSVGILLAIALSVLTWWGAFKATTQVRKLSGDAEVALEKLSSALDQLVQASSNTETAVKRTRDAAIRIADGTARDDPTLTAQIDNLLETLTPLLLQSESLGQSLQSISTILTSTAQIAGTIGQSADRVDKMRTAAQRLDEASSLLAEVRQNAAALKRGDAVPTARRLVELVERVEPPLRQLTEGLRLVSDHAEAVREGLPEARRSAEFWLFTGPVLITVLMVWFAVGQLCLLAWGWQHSQGAPPA